MSIVEMIAEHPHVDGHLNDPLAEVVKHAMYAAQITASCADACLGEESAADRKDCIRSCLDASNASEALAYIAARRTGSNEPVIKAAMTFAKAALKSCHAECSNHEDAHCKRCAKMCEELIADIEKAEL
ncbi:four-helix bundle copper-binding protein [Pacificimonas flava]|uniref:Four-helix bundle copper-binding protein n=2 Tax=Pacificimonas TaxID=1960290 RepID=A0A219B2I8_9SPHN|nr:MULTISPECIES: four-helix bundle copper-binding protein [Pacificimonas]MBZ6377795.1 four-helix bundle copper-binding protein [Pacificimonas aurantium]OWV32535.1 four-helix bundle copper-binding protein [Pacificimonas flava]